MRSMTLLLLTAAGCAAVPPASVESSMTSLTLPPPQSKTITIARVAMPWWAPRFLITGKFVDSLPQYAAAPGLEHKAYTFSEHHEFGGVYLWSSRPAAAAWFNEAWFERVRKQRGVEGHVELLDARFTVAGAAAPHGRELPHHALRTDATIVVLKSTSPVPPATQEASLRTLATVHGAPTGLMRVSFVISEEGAVGSVSVFTSAEAARAFRTAIAAPAAKALGDAVVLASYDSTVMLDAAADQQVAKTRAPALVGGTR
jgi:hypothetical protein